MLKLIPIIIFVFVLSGCKMNYSFTGASIPPDAKTVSIENFPNMALLVNPNLSMTIAEALKDKFMSQTGLQLVKRDGDLQFSGTITAYNIKPIAIQSGDVAAQNRFSISVKVKFVNKYDTETNFDSKFSRYWDYESSNNFQSNEDAYVEIVVNQLIDDIFNKSVVNW